MWVLTHCFYCGYDLAGLCWLILPNGEPAHLDCRNERKANALPLLRPGNRRHAHPRQRTVLESKALGERKGA